VNMRRMARASLVLGAAGCLFLVAPGLGRTQDNVPAAPEWQHSYTHYGPGAYSNYGYPRFTVNYGPFRSTPGYSFYRPLQPDDWGNGPCGPRHNLNASQKSPSGMTWW
jgi:hypothetical protein